MPLQVIMHLQVEIQHSGITTLILILHHLTDQVRVIQYLPEEVLRVHHHLTHQALLAIHLQEADHHTATDLPIQVPEVHFLQVPLPEALHQWDHHQAALLHQVADHRQEADLHLAGDR